MTSLPVETLSCGETLSEERDITLLYSYTRKIKRFQHFIKQFEKGPRFIETPSIETKLNFHIILIVFQKVSEFGQEIPQSQTADQLMVP